MRITLQLIAPDGRIDNQHLDWQEQSTEIQERIEKAMDSLPEDCNVFIVIDVYSVHKERRK